MMILLKIWVACWAIFGLVATSESVTADNSTIPNDSDRSAIDAVPVPVDTTHVITTRLNRLQRLRLQTSFVTPIELSAIRGPSMRLGDLLAKVTGLQVRNYGGPGAMATVSVRGINPGRVEIYIDNIPLRSAATGAVDLSSVDLAQIESIEVYRSAPPENLGGEAAGAAICLKTRSGGDWRHTLRLGTGSYNSTTVETSLAGHLAEADFFLSASHFTTDGDFSYFSDNGTEHNPDDDQIRSWSNGDISRQALFGKLSRQLSSRIKLQLSSQAWWSDQGVPGTSHCPTIETQQQKNGHLQYLALATELPWHYPLDFSLSGYTGTEKQHFRDPQRELDITGAQTRVDHEQNRLGGLLKTGISGLAFPRLGLHRLELLADSRRERFNNLSARGAVNESRRQRTAGTLSIGDRIELYDDRLHLDLFYRWERSENNYHHINPYRPFTAGPTHISEFQGPRAGFRWSLGDDFTIKANYGTDARYPTFTELFGYEGAVQGNPSLVPESGKSWDIGWLWHPENGPHGLPIRFETAYYHSRLDEMIVLITVSGRETKPVNLDQAAIKGVESNVAIGPLPLPRQLPLLRRGELEVESYFDWQESRDEGVSPVYHGNELTYHPRWRGGGRLTLSVGDWSLCYNADYRGALYWGRSNLPEYQNDGFWNHELLFRWRCRRELTLSVRSANLLDQEQEDIRGYPLPGRAWYGSMELVL